MQSYMVAAWKYNAVQIMIPIILFSDFPKLLMQMTVCIIFKPSTVGVKIYFYWKNFLMISIH